LLFPDRRSFPNTKCLITPITTIPQPQLCLQCLAQQSSRPASSQLKIIVLVLLLDYFIH
jgi:hypothetical protein